MASYYVVSSLDLHRLDQFDTPMFLVYSHRLNKHALVWHYERNRGFITN